MKSKPHSERGCRNVCASVSVSRLLRLETHRKTLGKIASPGGLAKQFVEMVADLETAQVVTFLRMVKNDFHELAGDQQEQIKPEDFGGSTLFLNRSGGG